MFDSSFYEVLHIVESFSVILGVAFVVIQIRLQTRIARADHDRHKKQSTIEFYDLISKGSYQLLDDIKDKDLNLSIVNTDKALKKSVTRYLARLERLAVGVYYEEKSPNSYKEFERLVKDIDKNREECPGEIIGKKDRVKQL